MIKAGAYDKLYFKTMMKSGVSPLVWTAIVGLICLLYRAYSPGLVNIP